MSRRMSTTDRQWLGLGIIRELARVTGDPAVRELANETEARLRVPAVVKDKYATRPAASEHAAHDAAPASTMAPIAKPRVIRDRYHAYSGR